MATHLFFFIMGKLKRYHVVPVYKSAASRIFARYGVQVLHWTPTSFPRTAMHSWTELLHHSSFIAVETTRIDLAWLVMFQISFTTCALDCQGSKHVPAFLIYTVHLWTTFFSWDRSDYIYIYIYLFIYLFLYLYIYIHINTDIYIY